MSRNPTGATSTETTFKSRARSITASAFLLANTLIWCPLVWILSTPENAKLALRRWKRKHQINPPIKLTQLVERRVHQQTTFLKNANVIGYSFNLSNLV
jgi:hypothetical protein